MRMFKATTVLTTATTVLVIALLAITCLPTAPAHAGGALISGSPAYNVLVQYSQMFADQNWHLISTDKYCWQRSKPIFLYTYDYSASSSSLEIESINSGQIVTWLHTPSTGWVLQ